MYSSSKVMNICTIIITLILITQFIALSSQKTFSSLNTYLNESNKDYTDPRRLLGENTHRKNVTKQLNKYKSNNFANQDDKKTVEGDHLDEFLNKPPNFPYPISQKIGYNNPINMSTNTGKDYLNITGNNEFILTAAAELWTGDGSEDNPYIIENYNFTNPTSEPSRISLKHVSLYFIILNCDLNGTGQLGSTIFLDNVTNGLIIGNIIRNSDYDSFGIEFTTDSANNTIKYNIFNNTPATGSFQNIFSLNYMNNFTYNHWDDYGNTTDLNNDGVYDGWYTNFNGTTGNVDKTPRVFKQFWNHKQIEIGGNLDLDTLVTEEGWPGNGTIQFPYVISNINITTPNITVNPCVWTYGNINRFIRFENCHFQSNGTLGGFIVNGTVSNIIINQSTIFNCSEGIIIDDSGSSFNFTYTKIYNCTNEAIWLKYANYTYVAFNHLFNNSAGIKTYATGVPSYNIFYKNVISDGLFGIYDEGGVENKIINNTLLNNDKYAIGIEIQPDDLLVENNSITGSLGSGISCNSSGNCTIYRNIIQNNSQSGIRYDGGGFIHIIKNIVYNSSIMGIHCLGSRGNISGNVVYNNSLSGIDISGTYNVTDNNMYFNTNGLWGGGINSSIKGNTIFSNLYYGIYLSPANGAKVTRNKIFDNEHGIALWDTNTFNNIIFLNDILNNRAHQIYDENSNPTLNKFSYEFLGNYFNSNYTGVDYNEDMVGDEIYSFTGNNDSYPLMVSSDYFSNITYFDSDYPSFIGSVLRNNEYITVNGSLDVPNSADLTLSNVTLRFAGTSNGSTNLQVNGGFSSYNSHITSANISNRFYLNAISGNNFYLENTTINFAGHSNGNPGVQIGIDDSIIINCSFRNNYRGIILTNTNNTIIKKCSFKDSITYGVYISLSNNTNCDKCTIEGNNNYGINDWATLNTTINNSVVKNNKWSGIRIEGSNYSIIENTNISFNQYGLLVSDSNHCNITHSRIWNSTEEGIWSGTNVFGAVNNSFSFLEIFNCTSGILFDGINHSRITYSNIYNNSLHGIFLDNSTGNARNFNNYILWNNISWNYQYGILLTNVINHSIIGNRFHRNHFTYYNYGIDIESASSNNLLYENYFLYGESANDLGTTNSWDNGSHGNYWSTYTGHDLNNDSIGDYPFNIHGGYAQDNFVLGFFQSFEP